MKDKQVYFITGASGFIGGWLAETLSLRPDTKVLAAVRQWSNVARIARFPVEIVLCDILNRKRVEEAMSDATVVVHCAVGGGETITEGTNNLLQAAQSRGIQRFIHLSSAVVYGNATGEVNEDIPTQMTGNEYADAKISAEQLCWDRHRQGLPITILRPSIVYGPFSSGWTTRIAEKLISGRSGLYDELGEGVCNLIYVKDLIRAIILCALKENASGEVFNINSSETITWNRYFEEFNDALNLPPLKRISTGKAIGQSAARDCISYFSSYAKRHFSDLIRDLNRRSRTAHAIIERLKGIVDLYPSSNDLKGLYSRDCHYDSTKVRNLLGFSSSYGLSAGLQESVQWLKLFGHAH